MTATSDRTWQPVATWEVLRIRAHLLATIRGFFVERGFLEVETPLLSADVVVDRHLEPFAVPTPHDAPSGPAVRWLQTSPEFHMKRLLAAGGQALYQITRAFRQGELGPRHNPEFTLVEWYRVGDDLHSGMQLLSDLGEALLHRGPATRLTYRQAFWDRLHLDPHPASVAELAAAARANGVTPPADMPNDVDVWRDLLLVECVEPDMGRGPPTLLYDYPASQSALARIRDEQPPVAERFELYADGMELANGYHELLDADVLAARNARANIARQQAGLPRLPEESRLLAAMRSGLPACAGVALGFDRVAMLVSGARTIGEVLAFPYERA